MMVIARSRSSQQALGMVPHCRACLTRRQHEGATSSSFPPVCCWSPGRPKRKAATEKSPPAESEEEGHISGERMSSRGVTVQDG